MLVDTGASTSVFPQSGIASRNLSALKHHLVGAGGAKIHCYGSRMIALQFAVSRYTWDFEVADIKKPILGAVFRMAHSLVVDLQRGCLTSNKDQHLTLPCDLHVLSSINGLLETEFRYVVGLEPFDHLSQRGYCRHRPHPLQGTPSFER